MKKLFSFILAGTMVLSLSAPAYAAEAENPSNATANQASSNKASIGVKGTYLSELKSDEIISVVVAWDDMNFIYYGSQEGSWNPTAHTYTGEKTAKWNKTTSEITVTNHSNAAVTANLSYEQSVSTVTGEFDKSVLNLISAAEGESLGDTSKAPADTSIFTIGGIMDDSSDAALGTITVSLNQKNDPEGGDSDEDTGWTVVKTAEELEAALKAGGNIKFGADITTGKNFNVLREGKLDLNQHTLTCNQMLIDSRSDVGIANGTIISSDSMAICIRSTNAIIEDCVLTGNNYYALYLEGASVTVKKSTLNGGVCVSNSSDGNSTLTATENVTVTKIEKKYATGISVGSGSTALFGFDPTGLTSAYNAGSVTANGDGTWTIS